MKNGDSKKRGSESGTQTYVADSTSPGISTLPESPYKSMANASRGVLEEEKEASSKIPGSYFDKPASSSSFLGQIDVD